MPQDICELRKKMCLKVEAFPGKKKLMTTHIFTEFCEFVPLTVCPENAPTCFFLLQHCLKNEFRLSAHDYSNAFK